MRGDDRYAVFVDVIARGHHVIIWCAAFEPVMVRAVDQDKFARTIPPLVWLIYPGLTASGRDPESVSSHSASQCLNGDSDPVTLPEHMWARN